MFLLLSVHVVYYLLVKSDDLLGASIRLERCLSILASGLMLLLKKGQYFTLIKQKVRRQISNPSIY